MINLLKPTSHSKFINMLYLLLKTYGHHSSPRPIFLIHTPIWTIVILLPVVTNFSKNNPPPISDHSSPTWFSLSVNRYSSHFIALGEFIISDGLLEVALAFISFICYWQAAKIHYLLTCRISSMESISITNTIISEIKKDSLDSMWSAIIMKPTITQEV